MDGKVKPFDSFAL